MAEGVRLKQPPGLGGLMDAHPRIASGATAGVMKRLNAQFSVSDAKIQRARKTCPGGADSDWAHTVYSAMRGPAYLAFTINDEYTCGKRAEVSRRAASAYDLATGEPVLFEQVLPGLGLARKSLAGPSGESFHVYESAKLAELYVAFALDGWKPEPGEPDCASILPQTALQFSLWPDAEHGGIGVVDSTLPQMTSVCTRQLFLDAGQMAAFGAPANFLDAISTARRGWKRE